MTYTLDSLSSTVALKQARRQILASATRDGITHDNLRWRLTWEGRTHYTLTATAKA